MNKKRPHHMISQPKEIEEILNQQIKAALREHNRPRLGLFLSAFAAGLEVGFSVFLISTMHNLLVDQVSAAVLQIVLALSYPIGFIFVVIGRSELFTEHTTLAILPVLTGSTTKRRLLVLWSTIFVGNLVGGYLFSAILINLSPNLGIASEETFVALAHHAIRHESGVILLSAIVAGWLMGLLAWLVTASTETISRIVIIVLVTSLIGIGGLHHSIVGSIEVFTGMVTSPSIHFSDYLNFQLWTTLGNLIGGVFFVALIKYGHTRRIR